MKYKINLQGKTYEVEVERGEAILLSEYETAAPAAPAIPAPAAAPAAPAASPAPQTVVSGTPVKAPLPGSIVSIMVNEGDGVKAGALLMVIEAMKMENEVLAPADGVVRQILVEKGAMVATGDTLVVI